MASLIANRGATGMGQMMTGNKIPKGYSQGQLQQFTPEQMQLFQRMFSQLGPEGFLSQLSQGSPEMFEQLEAPAKRQFSDYLGGISSRFSGMGSGARKSSGFQNTVSGAAADFAERLQAQRLGLQGQAMQDLMNMSGQLLQQRPYEQFVTPKQTPFWQKLAEGGLGGLAGGFGSAFGGKAFTGLFG